METGDKFRAYETGRFAGHEARGCPCKVVTSTHNRITAIDSDGFERIFTQPNWRFKKIK